MSEWKVLIIEDDAMVARVHARLVARTPGFTLVGAAQTAEQGLDMINNLRPHLVLLDLGLPGRSGVALLRRLRAAGSAVEVVAITATRRAAIVAATAQLGVLDYIAKPTSPDRLQQALSTFRHRMQAATGDTLEQPAIDKLIAAGRSPQRWLPRELDQDRLVAVRGTLETRRGVTASDVAALVGISRVTARRYLEYLVTIGEADVDAHGDGPGRPTKLYSPRGGDSPGRRQDRLTTRVVS
jgi:response regulator of citrate/malate metabolism